MRFNVYEISNIFADLRVGSYVEQELSKCSNLCSEKKDCCDIKALCRCGTHTGKYECVCSAGYHGSGLVSGCFGKQYNEF